MCDAPKHKYAIDQHLMTKSENLPPVVKVMALPTGTCRAHDLPVYACEHGGTHWLVCEDLLTPIEREKLN